MKSKYLLGLVAIMSLTLMNPTVSMASRNENENENEKEKEHGIEVNDDRVIRAGLFGVFGENGFGVKANLGNSLSVRVDKIISRFDNNKDRYVKTFQKMRAKLVRIEAKLEDKGFDTIKLEADLVVLDTKIAKFVADYTAYIDALRLAQTQAEAGDDVAAKAQIVIAKGLLKTAKTSGLAVKTYYHDVVRVDIHDIKEQ